MCDGVRTALIVKITGEGDGAGLAGAFGAQVKATERGIDGVLSGALW